MRGDELFDSQPARTMTAAGVLAAPPDCSREIIRPVTRTRRGVAEQYWMRCGVEHFEIALTVEYPTLPQRSQCWCTAGYEVTFLAGHEIEEFLTCHGQPPVDFCCCDLR